MPQVKIKGTNQVIQFPDNMSEDEIKQAILAKVSTPIKPADRVNYSTVQSVQPTLQERAKQGLYDFLQGNIISDKHGAMQVADNIATLLGFLPGVGTAFAGDEAGRALKEGDYLTAGINTLGEVPGVGELAPSIFAGVMARGADLKALDKAKEMELLGVDRGDIWSETGWFNDRGDWKFEIDDSGSMLTGKGLDDEAYTSTGSALMHNKLYENYPDTGEIDLSLTNQGGGGKYAPYVDRGDFEFPQFEQIDVNQPFLSKRHSTALHELQHAVQERENFARGGAPNKDAIDSAVSQINKNLEPVRIKIDEIENSSEYTSRVEELIEQGYRKRGAKIVADKEFGLDKLNEKWVSVNPIERAVYNRDLSQYDAIEAYKRLAGEAEARNVQTRLDWTPEQRRQTPPWETLDVPEDELIYSKRGGVAESFDFDEIPKLSDKMKIKRDARRGLYKLSTKGDVANIKHITDLSEYDSQQLVNQMKLIDLPGIRQGGYLKRGDKLNVFYKDDGTSQFIDTESGKVLMDIDQEQTSNMIKNDVLELAEKHKTPEQIESEFLERKRNDAINEARERVQNETYKMQHTAPLRGDNPTGEDITSAFGDDIYTGNAVRYFGHGVDYDQKAIDVINQMKGSPDKEITIYRAVPKSVNEINPSDWVTTTKEYAKDHMAGEKGWHIISKKVKARDLATDGNSIHEWGYSPL